MSKDFNVQIRVRNGRLLRAIREQYGSTSELCRVAGLNNSHVSAMINFREKPFRKDGTLTNIAVALSSALGMTAGELWPEHLAKLQARKATFEIDMDAEEIAALPSDTNQETLAGYRQAISMFSDKLTDRQIYVLSQRATGATLEDLAKELGVNRERIRQIEAKSMRRMKERAAQKGIREFRQIA